MYNIKQSLKAKTVDEAINLLNTNDNSMICVGGTDILVKIRDGRFQDITLISLFDCQEIKGIKIDENGTISIGANTSFYDIYTNDIIMKNIPILGNACRLIGGPQIRKIGTIGGNICNGGVSADTLPSLYTLDAKLEIKSRDGIEIIPIKEFHTGVEKTIISGKPMILTRVIIEKESYEKAYGYYIKSGQRNALEISALGCAALVKLNKAKTCIEWVKYGFGVAGPVPTRCYKIESYLNGKEISNEIFDYIEEHILEELHPIDSWKASLKLKERLIKTNSVRALKSAIQLARGTK